MKQEIKMTMDVKVESPHQEERPEVETPWTKIFTLRHGRDPLMLEKIGGGEFENFQHGHFCTQSGITSDVTTFLKLGADWKKYLLDLQPTDQFYDGRPVTRDMQERWLWSAEKGRPYFDREGEFCFGLTNVLSQNVRVYVDESGEPLMEYFDNVRLHDGIYDNIPLLTVDGFRPEMKAWDVDWMIEKSYIVPWAAVNANGGVNTNVRGRIWQVIWDPRYFPCNLPGQKYIPLFYLQGYGLRKKNESS